MLPIKIVLPKDFLNEEIRCGYKVSQKDKEVWAIELDLYCQLKLVCEKYNLRLFADGGTVLGAIRHQGFIPWDDDMDFMMPRQDYIKLCQIAKLDFKFPYFFQTEQSDFGSLRGHGQLRNSATTGMLLGEKIANNSFTYNQGIFIDVFPFDGFPKSKDERKKLFFQCKKDLILARKFFFRGNNFCYSKNPAKQAIKSICRPIYHFFGYRENEINNLYLKYEKACQTYDMYKTEECINFPMSIYKLKLLPSRLYLSRKKVKFEFLFLYVPEPAEEYLSIVYGDWKKYVKNASTHGELFFDTQKSYLEYIKNSN